MSMGYYGIALQAAGAIIQAVAAQKASENMEKELRRKRESSAAVAKRAMDSWKELVSGSGYAQSQLDLERNAAERVAVNDSMAGMSFQGGETPIGDRRDAQVARQRGTMVARVNAYDDTMLDKAIRELRAQEKLTKIENFETGSLQVYPYQIYDAQHSADKMAKAGKMVSSAGKMMSSYSSMGGLGGSSMGGIGKSWKGGLSMQDSGITSTANPSGNWGTTPPDDMFNYQPVR